MNGCNVPLLLFVAITGLVTTSVVMLSDLPLWGACLLGFMAAIAGLFSLDVIADVFEKRQRRTGKSLDTSTKSGPRPESESKAPLPLRTDDIPLPTAPEDLCCPSCRSSAIAVIVYGLPALSEALERALAEGQITLGGCLVYDGAPQWVCTACNTKFGAIRLREEES